MLLLINVIALTIMEIYYCIYLRQFDWTVAIETEVEDPTPNATRVLGSLLIPTGISGKEGFHSIIGDDGLEVELASEDIRKQVIRVFYVFSILTSFVKVLNVA